MAFHVRTTFGCDHGCQLVENNTNCDDGIIAQSMPVPGQGCTTPNDVHVMMIILVQRHFDPQTDCVVVTNDAALTMAKTARPTHATRSRV